MINIKPNDYVQPTDVREDVVQKICDVLLTYLDENRVLTIRAKHPVLYLAKYEGKHETAEKFMLSSGTMNQAYVYTQVRSCEMHKAFEFFQDAGYHIYLERDKKTKTSVYRFSKKPVLDGNKAKNLEFDMFID